MNIQKKPTVLMILDGFGLSPQKHGNAVAMAKKPNLDRIFNTFPSTSLSASGTEVGLPDGQMGNSEVGHLNIGAGRIVYQDFSKITKAVDDHSFFENHELLKAIEHVKINDSTLHVQGLLSDGGVHSHISHLFAIIDMAKLHGIKRLAVHCFLDGRDVPPQSACKYISALEAKLSDSGIGKIGLISGRYYAMDRDKRWERVQKAYDAMTLPAQALFDNTTTEDSEKHSPLQIISNSYEKGIYDEFVLPIMTSSDCIIKDNDSIIMFNFRPDRAREITRAFTDKDFDGFQRKKTLNNLHYVCMTQYDKTITDVNIAYPPSEYKNTLGEYISTLGLKQLRIAETEKYAHVTFFFNGGVEEPNCGEDRILIPSPKVATYDLQPEMSAYKVTDALINAIDENDYDFVILNFANADMVGHTGNMQAAVKAIEAVDKCIGRIQSAVLNKGGQIFLTADHGNADNMIDENDKVVTAHSLNPVPFIHISSSPYELSCGGRLSDIAPTMLDSLNIKIPVEMTGRSLLIHK